ncbi:hypothetical protein HDU83_001177 [Entophlyctis luteolus]|nr:hypothetical protein HDU83_001177 [Entophlyctis luteolus]
MGNNVTIYARDHAVVDGINSLHQNIKYMKDVPLTETLKATNSLDEHTLSSVTVILFSIPTQHLRDILEKTKPFVTRNHLTIFVNKGIEISTGLLPCDIVEEIWGKDIGCAATYLVSGGNFVPFQLTPKFFTLALVRPQVYDCTDVIGVEVAGALKNVIALAAGACAGLGFQQNARAAIITRGLAEIMRVGVKLGADPLTFSGLSGVGDLFLTAQSEKSRNFTVGYRLGKGETLEHVLATLGSVAEGVETTKAAYELCKRIGVESPVCDAVYSVLYGGSEVKDAVKALMGRDPHAEFHGL